MTLTGYFAYGHNVQSGYFTDKAGTRTNLAVRFRNCTIDGKGLIVQEHVSFPADIASGKADLMSKPYKRSIAGHTALASQRRRPGMPVAPEGRRSNLNAITPANANKPQRPRRHRLDAKVFLSTFRESERVS